MDKIKFRCSGCGKAVNAPVAMAGKAAKCPSCGKTITVPVPAPSATAQQAAAQPELPRKLRAALDSLRSGTAEARLSALDELPSDLPREYFRAVQSVVLQAMVAGDGRVQLKGAIALARLGDESDPPVNTLLANVSSPPSGQERSVKCRALQGLSYVKGRIDIIDRLVNVAEYDEDPVVRERAFLALAATGNNVAKLFLDHEAGKGNKVASLALERLAHEGCEGLRATIVAGYDPPPIQAAQHVSTGPTGSQVAAKGEESPGPVVAEAAEERELDVLMLTEKERQLFAAFRSAVRDYRAVEEAERKLHADFEQAKRTEMSKICDEAQRLNQNVRSAEEQVRGTFPVRFGWAPSPTSVAPGPVAGTTGAEFSQVLITCSTEARNKSNAIQSLRTILQVIGGGVLVLLLVMLASGAGLVISFLVSVVAGVACCALATRMSADMFRALYRAVKTADAACQRWCEGARAYCEAEIAKSSENSRNVLARNLDSWREAWAQIQREETALSSTGNELAPLWDHPVWNQQHRPGRKPPCIRLGDYVLSTTLPTGDLVGVSVPAIVPFPGGQCLLLKTGDNIVAESQSGPEQQGRGLVDRASARRYSKLR